MTENLSSADGRRLVEGLHECPESVVVSADCLGEEYATHIGGQAVTITLPALADDPTQWGLVEPNWTFKRDQSIGSFRSWGEVTYRRGGVAMSAMVEAMRFSFSVEDDACQTAAEAVGAAIDGWWERVASWIEVTTDLDLSRLGNRDPLVLGQRLQIWTGDVSGNALSIRWRSVSYATPPQLIRVPDRCLLRKCFALAGGGVSPPLEWLFIRNARSLMNGGESRRAVIDAATAVELALQRKIDEQLAGATEVVKEALTRKYQMLSGRADLVKRLGGGSMPSRFQQVLAEPRNRAAHAGEDPSASDAQTAITMATEIVEQLVPLASLMPIDDCEGE